MVAALRPPSRMFSKDEELGKRDDDLFKPARPKPSSWSHSLRFRRRRILLGLLGLFGVWLFIHNIPTDLGTIDQSMGRPLRPGHNSDGVEFGYRPPARNSPQNAAQVKTGTSSGQAPEGAPPRTDPTNEQQQLEADHYYTGPIKFYDLAATLHGLSATFGYRVVNRNVLFAASSLRSAANLIPMACEMARLNRNHVHFMLLGRAALSMSDFQEINGIDTKTCTVYFHDGRPDYSEYSTDTRAEVSVAGALAHADTFMHPQVIITDDSAVEDAFFVRGVRAKFEELGKPIIEIPHGRYEDFIWMTRLDSVSLASWHKPRIQILIHAPAGSSGSLLRLLKSLSQADYAGLSPPDLMIELPPDIDPFLKEHIRLMAWPPQGRHASGPAPRGVMQLHHHIANTAQVTTESSALRFLETFYPADPDNSHVMLLSAQTELSPLFYQYLFLHLMEHQYAVHNDKTSTEQGTVFGITLTSPNTQLDGQEPFEMPTMQQMRGRKYGRKPEDDPEQPVPFLWQGPNADATLIFGKRWVEFHDYLTNRLRAMHDPTAVTVPPEKQTKIISEAQPGWTEYMLELIRARGWRILYPAKQETESWATVHKDLFPIPEEFLTSNKPTKPASEDQDDSAPPPTDEAFLRGDYSSFKPTQEAQGTLQASQPLDELLPFKGEVPEPHHLPLLTYDGQRATIGVLERTTRAYKRELRQSVGGCNARQAVKARFVVAGKTDDLFCFTDRDDFSDAEDDEDMEELEPGQDAATDSLLKAADMEMAALDATSVKKRPNIKLDIADDAAASLPGSKASKNSAAPASAAADDIVPEEVHSPPKKDQHINLDAELDPALDEISDEISDDLEIALKHKGGPHKTKPGISESEMDGHKDAIAEAVQKNA